MYCHRVWYTAFVFARGGSKGLPGKNIRDLAGKPLIAWAVQAAAAVDRVQRVIVSTDSPEIAQVARAFGAETPFLRPAELAQDDSPEWLAWRHALTHLKDVEGEMPQALLSVPTTAPLRTPLDLANCLTEYEQHRPDAVITVTPAHRNPWFNMVRTDDEGWTQRLLPTDRPPVRRQDGPQVWDVTTVGYVVNADFIMTHDSLFEGSVRSVQVPAERAIDIDSEFDFRVAELLLSAGVGADQP